MNKLTADQEEFLNQFVVDNFHPIRSINAKHSAYGLKQKFSRVYFYVTTEQFTRAMRNAGFIAQPIGNGNACFNISQESPYFFRDLG